MRLIEAVPNFSTADPVYIDKICMAIDQVPESYVLHADPDKDYNRTVITFVSSPESIINASLAAIRTAADLIDMRNHHGEHPRIGAIDVFPLIPIQNVEEQECINFARKIAEIAGEELDIPTYCYGKAALSEDRIVLSDIRRGQYEGLAEKISQPRWKPDFGPMKFNPKSGGMVVGVRNFLIAYNINLDTQDVSVATQIARRIRTSGYLNENGTRISGRLNGIQAMGVRMERPDRGLFTQVSTNILDFQSKDSLHHVYEATKEEARKLNVRVTGSEVVGLIPQNALVTSLQYYDPSIHTDNMADGLEFLGLHDLYEFDIEEKVLENRIKNRLQTSH